MKEIYKSSSLKFFPYKKDDAAVSAVVTWGQKWIFLTSVQNGMYGGKQTRWLHNQTW